MFGSLRQTTVLGLEDQSEGLGVMRNEDEGNNRLYWMKGKDIVSIVLATNGHMGCLITSNKEVMFFVPSCMFVFS